MATTPIRPFVGDWDYDTEYPALGYDSPWNGWATPIVDGATLQRLIADSPGYRLEYRQRVDGDHMVVFTTNDTEDGTETLYADLPWKAGYHLGTFGWTFVEQEGADDRRQD